MSRSACLLLVPVAAACGAPAGTPKTSTTTQPSGAPAALPEELPSEPACIGFLPTGEGAVVITTRRDRFAGEGNGEGVAQTWIGLAMRDGAKPPLALVHEVAAETPDAWRTERAELARQLDPLALVPCIAIVDHERAWATPAGTVTEDWDPVPAVNADEHLENDVARVGRVKLGKRTLMPLTSGPHDGTDHEGLGGVYTNPDASALALLIENFDTGLAEQRVVVVRTRE